MCYTEMNEERDEKIHAMMDVTRVNAKLGYMEEECKSLQHKLRDEVEGRKELEGMCPKEAKLASKEIQQYFLSAALSVTIIITPWCPKCLSILYKLAEHILNIHTTCK